MLPARPWLSAASSGLCLASEAHWHAASSSLPSTFSPQEKCDTRGVSLHFSSLTHYKHGTRGARVWQTSVVHMFGWTFMAVGFCVWFLTRSGNLIKWVTAFMCECCGRWGGGIVASTGAWSVKVSFCCHGLSLLPASPACHVCVREDLKWTGW